MVAEVPATPNNNINNSNSTTSIMDLLQNLQDGSNDNPTGKKHKHVHLTTDQFLVLMHCFEKQQQDISAFLTNASTSTVTQSSTACDKPSHQESSSTQSTKPSDHYNNAKYEDIICHPIKPFYDGMPEALIAFLNHLDIHHQDEDWSSITNITKNNIQYDLICHFAKIHEDTMITLAKSRWHSPMLNQDNTPLAITPTKLTVWLTFSSAPLLMTCPSSSWDILIRIFVMMAPYYYGLSVTTYTETT